MAGAFTTLSILDAGGTSRTMRVWDESGAGTGPFSFAQTISDGTAGGKLIALDSFGDVKSLIVDSTGAALGYNPNGRTGAANSAPVVRATEDRQASVPDSRYTLLSALATTNIALISASARGLHVLRGQNKKAAAVFIRLYDKATAPVPASDTPIATFECTASAPFDLDFKGYPLVNGLGIVMTGAAGNTDTTALSAGDITSLYCSYAT